MLYIEWNVLVATFGTPRRQCPESSGPLAGGASGRAVDGPDRLHSSTGTVCAENCPGVADAGLFQLDGPVPCLTARAHEGFDGARDHVGIEIGFECSPRVK